MARTTSGIDLKKAVDSAVKAAHDYYAGQELHNMLPKLSDDVAEIVDKTLRN